LLIGDFIGSLGQQCHQPVGIPSHGLVAQHLRPPLKVTLEEAEVAVALAVGEVELFQHFLTERLIRGEPFDHGQVGK
jgi:hypothetical protein